MNKSSKPNFFLTYNEVLALYPPQDDYDNRITYGYLLTHQGWACPGAQIILSINKYNPAGSGGFIYYFEHIDSFPNWHEPICGEAVCHAEELAFVWDTVEFVSHDLFHMTPEEEVLANTMMRYWGQFSKTGNPSLPDLPTWNPFVTASNQSIILDTPTYADAGHIQKYCDFWDSQAFSSRQLRQSFRRHSKSF